MMVSEVVMTTVLDVLEYFGSSLASGSTLRV